MGHIDLTQTDFTVEESRIIINQGLKLIQHGYLPALNLIHSKDEKLPQNKIIIHYLQEAEKHIEYVKSKIEKRFDVKNLIVPRMTFYALDPEYVKKPDFKETYKDSDFYDKKLNPKHIDEVIKDPSDKTVGRKELDLLIDMHTDCPVNELAKELVQIDKDGPVPWIHPAIIIRSEDELEEIEGFLKKDYLCIARECSEFYTVIYDEKRKEALWKYLDRAFKKVKNIEVFEICRESVLVYPAQINLKLEEYMRDNIFELRFLE